VPDPLPARHPYLDVEGPVAMAHRGFDRGDLENSMAAFAAAVDLGYRYLETDVHATRDGVLVAFHDDWLDRVTDGSGAIARLTWAQVRQARIGGREPIPRLEDVLGTWPDVRVNIDVKHRSAIRPLVEVLRRTGATRRVCIASFSDLRRAAVVRALGPSVATSLGVPRVSAFLAAARTAPRSPAVLRRAGRGAVCLQVPEALGPVRVVDAATVRAAHVAGLAVHVWTVNDAADMHRLLDLGVDGIVTDRADTLRDVLVSRGQWAS
jgi:glycerophosphoryl diester phosphodiesterase